MSLFYTGSQQEAIDILLSLLDKKDEYSLLAQDALFLISSELRKYNIMEDAVARNIDFTDSRTDILWAHMLNDSRYSSEVAIYEGAYLWGHGVWRSTESSIMHNANWLWFNAPSREAIYKAIMRASEGPNWQYDFENFAAYDVINRNTTRSSISVDKRKVIHKAPTIVRGNRDF